MMVTEQEHVPPSSLGLVLLCDGMYGRARKHAFVLMKYGGVFDSVDDKEGLSLTCHMTLLCQNSARVELSGSGTSFAVVQVVAENGEVEGHSLVFIERSR